MDKRNIKLEIDHVLEQLAKLEPNSPEYTVASQNLKTLCEADSKSSIDINTVVTVAANLLGLVLVLHYERFNVIASRAFNFVWRR